nr:MAG TPA: hypothetical protein [Caudoviricetes sp.]
MILPQYRETRLKLSDLKVAQSCGLARQISELVGK